VQLRVGLGDAGPGGAAAPVGGGQLPKRVAGLDGEGIWGLCAGTKTGGGDDQHGAGLDAGGIGDVGIAGEELVPAGALP
jgi:hypothetical protein